MSVTPATGDLPVHESPSGAAPEERTSMASSSLWAAVSQLALLGVQGLAAVAILLTFGKNTDTDGLFAAYSVYGLLVLMCQTLRLTVVARVVESASPWIAFDRFLGAGLALVAVAGIAQIGLGAPIGRLLTGDLGAHAAHIARATLAILWPAFAAQLVAALGAAVLGVRQEFRYPGIAYVAGGVANLAVLLGLSAPLGVLSAATGVAAGSIVTAVAMAHRLWREGYRPSLARILGGAREVRTSAMLVVASLATVMTQLNFVASLSFAARLRVGDVTLYTTAFFAGAIVVAITASPAALVLAAPVAQTWDRRPDGLLPHLRTIMRAGLMLVAPAVAVAALVGDEVLDLLFGASFSAGDADRAIATFAALTGLYIAILAMQLPLLAAYALSRYRAVGALSLTGSAVHVALSAVAVAFGSIVWLGVATSLSGLVAMGMMIALVHGRGGTLRAVAIVAAECAVIALPSLAAFGPPALAARLLGGGVGWDVLAAAVGTVAFGILLRVALPGHAAVAHRMVEPLLPARLRPVAA